MFILGVLPLFSRRHVPLGLTVKMTVAFGLLALAIGYAAVAWGHSMWLPRLLFLVDTDVFGP